MQVRPASLLVCLALLAQPVVAGSQARFTELLGGIENGLVEEAGWLAQGGSLAARWLEGKRLLYLPDKGRYTVDLIDRDSGKLRRLASHEDISRSLRQAGLRLEDCELDGLEAGTDQLVFLCGEDAYRLEPNSLRATREVGGAVHANRGEAQSLSDQFPTTFGPLVEAASPDGRWFVTEREHNLYLRSAADGSLRPLTRDGHLRETWRNTQESAQSFNVFWSADSRTIAAVQLDTRDVWHEPTLQLLENPPRTIPIAYPRAGEAIHRFRLFFIDIDTGKKVAIDTGDTTDHYVDIIGWQGDDEGILVQVLDREHKRRRIYSANRHSGRMTLLLEDVTDTYHDSWMTLFIDFTVPLKRGAGFLYLSEESGWRHIQRFDGSGKRLATLTSGKWAVERIVYVDETIGQVYFLAATSADAPYALQLYRASMTGKGEPELLTSGKGRIEVAMAPDGQNFVSRESSPQSAPVVRLHRANGDLVRELSRFNDHKLLSAGFGGVETVMLSDTSGRWLQPVTIMRPYHFDPKQSYPVIEHIYGGMQSIHTRHGYYGFGAGHADDVTRMLLHSGYVVLRVDAPGTPGRGRVFQDAVYARWPQSVIPNHVKAIRAAAATRPWMDLVRVGIYGHSWGAYMAQRAMVEAPAFYRAAAVHNGGSDFYDQPTYIEPFMGLPQNNPEAYAAASNLERVEDIRGAIMAFTAPHDVNSGFSPAFKLVDALIAARKNIELVITPRSNHRMACCEDPETLHKLTKIRAFFDAEIRAIARED